MNSFMSNLRNKIFIPNIRQIHRSRMLKNIPDVPKEKASNSHISKIGLTDLKVNKFEKRLLVWGGMYKRVEDVPNLVNQGVLEKARNKARIKINLVMAAATLLGCFFMIYLGKKAAARGESITTINEKFKKESIESLNKKED